MKASSQAFNLYCNHLRGPITQFFGNNSGNPQPIRTKIGTSQGKQRSKNFGLDRPIGGKWGHGRARLAEFLSAKKGNLPYEKSGWLWWPQSCPNLAYRKCTQYTARPILIKNCSKHVIPSKGCEQCSTKFLGVKNVILCAVYSPVATSQYASGFWLFSAGAALPMGSRGPDAQAPIREQGCAFWGVNNFWESKPKKLKFWSMNSTSKRECHFVRGLQPSGYIAALAIAFRGPDTQAPVRDTREIDANPKRKFDNDPLKTSEVTS